MSLTHSETVEAVKSKIDLIADILCRGYDVELRNVSSLKTVKVLEVRKRDVCKHVADNGDSGRFDALGNTEHVEAEKTALQVNTTC